MSDDNTDTPAVAMPTTKSRRGGTAGALVRCMRPKQWTKNALLFSGLFLNARFDVAALWLSSAAGFAIFCLLSGSVYIVNDLKDIAADRLHPKKRHRPLAAGEVTPGVGLAFALLLLIGALGWSYFFGFRFLLCAASYWLLVLAYSLGLKHAVIVDVMALAAGFVLRALGGLFVIEVAWQANNLGELPITGWFLSCTMFLALFIALAKRRAELVSQAEEAGNTRRVLREYTVPLLDQLIAMTTSLVIMTYALYCMKDPANPRLLITLPFVLFGVMRFMWHVYRNDEGGAPEILLYKDKALLACVVGWAATLALLIAH